MKTVIANVINDLAKIPNLDELMPKEMARATELVEQGTLKHLFIKDDHTGAVLVLANVNAEEAKKVMESFPMFPQFQEVIYTETEQSF